MAAEPVIKYAVVLPTRRTCTLDELKGPDSDATAIKPIPSQSISSQRDEGELRAMRFAMRIPRVADLSIFTASVAPFIGWVQPDTAEAMCEKGRPMTGPPSLLYGTAGLLAVVAYF
jgi:hypothetical protein